MQDIAAAEREKEEIRRKEVNQIIKARAKAEEKAKQAEEKEKKEAGRKARRAEEEAGRNARRAEEEAGRKARREAAKTAKAKSKQARTASGPTTRKNILERLRRQFTSSTGNNTSEDEDEDEDKDTYASPEESDPNIRKAAEEEAIREVKRITEAEEKTTPIDADTKQKMNDAFEESL